MLKNKLLVCLVTGLVLGLFIAASAVANPYTFQLDKFEIAGNLSGNITDDFNDGTIDTALWDVYDPTVTESGTTISFQNPGAMDQMQLGSLRITSEMSYLHYMFSMKDGSGNYTGTSTWNPAIPGTNQFYVMNLSSIGTSTGPDENVIIGVANFDANVSAFFGSPTGPMVFFGRSKDVANGDFSLQGFSITPAIITGDILLRLAFDDATNLFSGAFSLDGGATFLTPFSDVASTGELLSEAELTLGGESWDVQVVPLPSSLLLLSFGLTGIWVKRTIRSKKNK